MIGGLPLGFAEPLVLIGLLTLPVLWWLLRLIPPRPRRIDFPPTRLLLEIAPKEETPARTPWWLTLMRLALAALVIIAAAGPLWHPPLATTKSRAPIAILIDDGWAAAATWDARVRTADDIIARAEDDRRAVALIPLSEGARDISLETGRFGARATAPDEARSRTRSTAPKRCRRCRGSSPTLTTSNWCGCPTAPISAAAPNSSRSSRSPRRPSDHDRRRRRCRRPRPRRRR